MSLFGIRMRYCQPRIWGRQVERLQADRNAHVAQMVERVLGKDEVISSILIMGSMTMNDYER